MRRNRIGIGTIIPAIHRSGSAQGGGIDLEREAKPRKTWVFFGLASPFL